MLLRMITSIPEGMMTMSAYPLLAKIDNPSQLRQLRPDQLNTLASELRQFLIESVAKSGGHFASGLGVIELTIALHYIFNTPHDALIFDVGHQAYPHKILTERKAKLSSIRQLGGLAPFPTREESHYDVLGVGHSSTSISAAVGLDIAHKQYAQHGQKTIAIIGDGALTAGMAFEALNHAGDIRSDVLVILNDNEMSISNNVGALNNLLTRTFSDPFLQGLRSDSKDFLAYFPTPFQQIARKAEEHVKGLVAGGTLFEELGFQYFGPIDGHDFSVLLPTLANLKHHHGPKLLHVVTKKGKGFSPAETAPIRYHALTPSSHKTNSSTSTLTYTQVFSQWIQDQAKENSRIVAITPAMREGSGLVEFSEHFPERYFDVGIAEQHAVTLAAGMAIGGLKPIVAIYSTFLQRAYDQLIHDIALQNLPVVFAIDRAGIVGPDGATHAGSFDLSFLRCIPNMLVCAPSDENECYHLLNTALAANQPAAVRYPRGKGLDVTIDRTQPPIPVGQSKLCRQGQSLVIIGIGVMTAVAMRLGETFNATVIDLRFIKPLDTELLTKLCETHQYFITIEDNAIAGGAGSAVAEWLHAQYHTHPIKHFGLPDVFLPHGERDEILALAGLSLDHLEKNIHQCLQQWTKTPPNPPRT